MKKKWFYLAATLLLAGCAEDAFEDTNMQETTERQEIKLSAGTTGISVESRGAGTVGGLNGDASNVWNGQQLIIWGFKNDADLTKVDDQNVKLDGITATAPTNTAKGTIALNGGPHYYPTQGAFHFVGYYIDDAADGEVSKTADAITQAVTIDGSQDIMIAKAELTGSQKVDLVESLIEYGKLTASNASNYVETTNEETKGNFVDGIGEDDKTLIEQEYKKAFSSYAARRGVQPEMTFKHQLARLKFSVIAGDENAKGDVDPVQVNSDNYQKGVLIESITLIEAKTKGIITIKNPDEANDIEAISFAHDASNEPLTADGKYQGFLTLKEKASSATATSLLQTLTPIAPKNKEDDTNAEYTPIGESILAFPPDDYYKINIATLQYVQSDGNSGYTLVEDADGKSNTYYEVPIKLSGNNTKFEAGKTYDIKIKVYSNQEIVITATLEGWIHGGGVNISPEDDEWNDSQNTTTP